MLEWKADGEIWSDLELPNELGRASIGSYLSRCIGQPASTATTKWTAEYELGPAYRPRAVERRGNFVNAAYAKAWALNGLLNSIKSERQELDVIIKELESMQ